MTMTLNNCFMTAVALPSVKISLFSILSVFVFMFGALSFNASHIQAIGLEYNLSSELLLNFDTTVCYTLFVSIYYYLLYVVIINYDSVVRFFKSSIATLLLYAFSVCMLLFYIMVSQQFDDASLEFSSDVNESTYMDEGGYNNVEQELVTSLSPITSDEYIPYDPTPSLNKGVTGLNNMYDHLVNSDPNGKLHKFIDQHCSHLLKPLVGDTPISINMVNPSYLEKHCNTVALGNKYTTSYLKDLHISGKPGIYVFYEPSDDVISVCGSNIDYAKRLMDHFDDSLITNKPFYVNGVETSGGLSAYHWNPIAQTKNYVTMYFMENGGISPKEEYYLTSFMQQEIRSLEQAVDSYANPKYYTGQQVNTWHNNWKPGKEYVDSSPYGKGKATTWVTMEGESFTTDSLTKAADQLGISNVTVKRNANVLDHYVNSPNYGKVKITIANEPILDKFPERTDTPKYKSDNVPDDLEDLIPNMVYLYDSDMNQLPYGPYKNVSEANEAIGIPRDKPWRKWVNKRHLIEAPLLGFGVYYIRNTVSTSMPTLVRDVLSGEVFNFPSMHSAIKFVYPDCASRTYFIRKYVLRREEFFSSHLNKTFSIQYANSKHHEETKQRYIKDDLKSGHSY